MINIVYKIHDVKFLRLEFSGKFPAVSVNTAIAILRLCAYWGWEVLIDLTVDDE
jgi:hypothetical protein